MKFPSLLPLVVLTANGTEMKRAEEHWWNDTDGAEQKYCAKNLSQGLMVHHEFQLDWPEIETLLLRFVPRSGLNPSPLRLSIR